MAVCKFSFTDFLSNNFLLQSLSHVTPKYILGMDSNGIFQFYGIKNLTVTTYQQHDFQTKKQVLVENFTAGFNCFFSSFLAALLLSAGALEKVLKCLGIYMDTNQLLSSQSRGNDWFSLMNVFLRSCSFIISTYNTS